MRLRRHYKSWLRLHPQEHVLVGESLATLCVVRLLLYVVPFRTITQRLRPRAVDQSRDLDDRSATIARMVSATANYVPRASCLTRSIALFSMLRRRGYAVVIKIGVDKKLGGKLDAHAWVETVDGACLPYNQTLGSTPIFTLRSHQTDDHPLGFTAVDR